MLDYEYVQKKFKPLERLRNVEFTRDWGLPFTFQPVDENIIKVFAALKNGTGNSVAYQFVNYHRSDNYNGFQNSVLQTANLEGWQMNNQFIITNFNTLNDKGVFLRPTIDLSRQFKKISSAIFRRDLRRMHDLPIRQLTTDYRLPSPPLPP